MKLTVLTENQAYSKFLAEFGISYLIEINGEKILWDTGQSDVFLKNAAKLGIDIHSEVKKVVLSHGHLDHGDGLRFLDNKKLITHPASFIQRFRKLDHTKVGLSMTKNEIEKKFILNETVEPYKISDSIWFLGEIPRNNDFEAKQTSFIDEYGNDDAVPDDSALAVIDNRELKIVTGCSHAGICNICEYAKKVTGIKKIKVVIGGFHLKYQNMQTLQTIAYFKNEKVERLLPSHCTELPALSAFWNEFQIESVKTGMHFEF